MRSVIEKISYNDSDDAKKSREGIKDITKIYKDIKIETDSRINLFNRYGGTVELEKIKITTRLISNFRDFRRNKSR